MHELSLAMNIVEIATEEADKIGRCAVKRIDLEIGSHSGVVMEALSFAMDEAIKGTPLAEAEINYHWVEAVAACQDCCQEFKPTEFEHVCPHCNSVQTYLIHGKELKVKSLELEEL